MIGKIIDFLFSPPPPPAHPSHSAAQGSPTATSLTYTTEPMAEAQPTSEVNRSAVFFMALLPCAAVAGLVSAFAAPALLKLEPGVVTSLSYSRWILGACGIPIGVAASWVIADALHYRRGQYRSRKSNGGSPWTRLIVWVLILVGSAAPLFKLVQASIVFGDAYIRVGSIGSVFPRTYTYDDIVRIVATTERGGDTILSPGTFYFTLEFSDGRVWDSRMYPETPWLSNASNVLRFVARKSGRYIEVSEPS